MAELKDIKFFKVTSLSTALEPNAIYFVLEPSTTSFKLYVTDLNRIPVSIMDETTTGSVLSVTGTAVTGTSANPKIDIATLVSSQLNNQVYLSLSDGKLQVNPITSPDNSIEVTSTSSELQIQLSAAIQTQINSALQSGANISEFTNDVGYLTTADIDATNLSYTPSATNGIVNSSTGTDATIPLAGALNAGLLSPSEKADIASAIQPSDLATVATTGEYSDLLNSPQTKAEFNSELTDGDFLFVGDITQYTDELAQDAVGSTLTDTDTIDLTYNNGSNTISAEVKANSIDASHLADDINISEFINDEGFETAAQLNVRDANNRNRANHTGIQLSSTIVDFDIAATAAVVENSITDGVTNKAPSENAVYDALDLKTTLSAGAFSGFAATNNGDGTISVGSGIAYLRATNDQYAPLIKYPIAAYNNIPLVDNLNNYIVVSYNGGSPALVLNTTGIGIDTQTTSIAIAAARVGTTVHYISLVGSNSDPNAKLRNRYLQSEGIRRVAGLAISATGRKIATTAGITYSGLIRLDVAAMNTNVSDTYTLAYNNGSTWTRVTGQTDINNTQYNNAGTLTALNNNNFRTDYIYALVNSPSKLYVILGNTQYNTIGAARLAPTPSSLPVELEQLGVLVGRAIIEKDAVTMEMASPFVQDFPAGAIENHNDLAGLQGGLADQRNHLTDAQVALVDGSEQTSNKQNSLAPDGTGVKFPTVDAVNTALNQTTYYVSNTGSDTNSGKREESPFLTISKVLSVIQNGDIIKFKCGDIFKEQLSISKTDITITSYGVGKNPIVDGSAVIATPTLVSGNLYTTTNTYGGSTAGRVVIFENGVAMYPVANNTECQALPGSYVAISGDSYAPGTYATVFHPSDSGNPNSNGKIYTTNVRVAVDMHPTATRLRIENVDSQYSFLNTTTLLYGEGNYLKNSKSDWGTKHNAFITNNSTGEGIIAYGAEFQGEYGRTATMYVAYNSNATGTKYCWKNCQAINDFNKPGIKKGKSLSGFLDHSGTGNFLEANFEKCYGTGLGTAIASNALVANITDCYFENLTSVALSPNNATSTNVKNSFFQKLPGGDSTNYNTGVVNIDNSVFIKEKISLNSEVHLSNTLIFNGFTTSVSAEDLSYIQNPTSTMFTSYGCIYFGYTFSLSVLTGKYAGDYNIFSYINAGNQIRNQLDGVGYTTLAAWQAATGQDANSVYLTAAQKETFFITDPNTGNVIINPFAKVTAANGTVYTGTFPDGTRISDKFTNKIFAKTDKTGAFSSVQGGIYASIGQLNTKLNLNNPTPTGTLDLTNTADTSTTASHYFVETASDGKVRPKTLANVKTEIVTTAAIDAAKPNILTIINPSTKTANYTTLVTDETILVDATTGNVVITLLTAAGNSGKKFIVKKIDSTVNTVTVSNASGIDGTTTKVYSTQYSGGSFQSNGTQYYIIGNF